MLVIVPVGKRYCGYFGSAGYALDVIPKVCCSGLYRSTTLVRPVFNMAVNKPSIELRLLLLLYAQIVGVAVLSVTHGLHIV